MTSARVGLLPAALLALASAQAAISAVCRTADDPDRPTIGLALGGGGARGYAHIGVLKRLHELRIPVDYVAGTSIGSIAGGLLAAGMSGEEIEAFASRIDWVDTFNDATPRQERTFRRKLDDDLALFGPKLGVGPDTALLPSGAISGQKILFMLETAVSERVQTRRFDELPIPFRAVAADLADGSEVVIGDGSVSLAIRASMAVPAVFDPVPYEETLLVDGGIANNLPVSVARAMGADRVIAVDVGSGLLDAKDIKDAVDVAAQLTNILVENTTRRQLEFLGDQDILIKPPLGDEVSSSDFDMIERGAEIGYQAALAMDEQLSLLSLDEAAYARYRARLTDCLSGEPVIHWVDLDNRSRFRESVIRSRLDVELGKPLDVAALERSLGDIYALGFLRIARYEVRTRDGLDGLYIEILEDERGSNLVEYGLDIFGDNDGSDFNLRVGYLKTDVDDYGAEFRALVQVGADSGLLLEYYKPFGDELRYILEPQLTFQRARFNEYDAAGNRLAEFEVEQSALQLSAAREFGRHGAIGLRARTLTGEADLIIGDPAVADADFDGGEWILTARYDRLDDAYFPGDGSLLTLDYVVSSDLLGSDSDYQQVSLEAFKAFTFGDRHTTVLGGTYSSTIEGTAPLFALFRAGGFLRLSGFEDAELAGQHFGLLAATYRYQLGSRGFLPAYLGASIEYGNVGDRREDVFDEGLLHGSVYFGFNTPIGPLYTGVGLGEDNRRKIFFRVGNVFRTSTIGR
jgi:NTE family protein